MDKLLSKSYLDKQDIVSLLSAEEDDMRLLFSHSAKVKELHVGNKVYFRGLIEFSNHCSKNCFYCGIRSGNQQVERYSMTDDEILDAARFAYKNGYGSVVLQSGENTGASFVNRIAKVIKEIKKQSDHKLGVTLSLGEQSKEVFQKWFDAGAHRYLLRIEASGKGLYQKIHPSDKNHDFETRRACLKNLKSIGYQVGSGVMIGLPYQTLEDLAGDLLFFREFDIDMVGMGPYVEHPDTPLFQYRNQIPSKHCRYTLALKMIAILRIMMPDINIAAATALQAIDLLGREKAIKIGANILMPNITPGKYRNKYLLYDNKPCIDENPDDCIQCLDSRIKMTGNSIGYDEWGDSKHFLKKH